MLTDDNSSEEIMSEKNPIDIHVGQRIRKCRQRQMLNQRELGAACNITSKQVHKHEMGLIPMPAYRLWKIANFLDVPIELFFEGLSGTPQVSAEEKVAFNRALN